LDWHDKSVPIRGRGVEVRPLGRRRDCDKYSIRKRDDGVIELVLYATPVVMWHPDNTVSVNFGRWASTMTCHFVNWLVPAVVKASVRQEYVALWMRDGEIRTMEQNETLVFDWTQGRMVPRSEAKPRYQLNLDRTKANIVRREHKEFIDFAKGMVGLMRMPTDGLSPVSHRYLADNDGVTFCKEKGSLGVGPTYQDWRVDECDREQATHYFVDHRIRGAQGMVKDKAQILRFMYLIADESMQSRNKAVATLFLACSKYEFGSSTKAIEYLDSETSLVYMGKVLLLLDEIILRANYERVLVRKQVKPDALGTNKYHSWLENGYMDHLPIAQK
tara:strand:+ start:86 stop:1078 length:993 start_codon:yes stop_codon:yes gene_type:complete